MVGGSAGLTAIRSGWMCNRYGIEVELLSYGMRRTRIAT
jgi:hypothetical protein